MKPHGSNNPYEDKANQLERGAEGDAVRLLQQRLIAVGVNPGPVDGKFGPLTQRGVKAFQEAMNLSISGVVDKHFWESLDKLPPAYEQTVLLYRNPLNPLQPHLLSDYSPEPPFPGKEGERE
jgi:peptidoglycan hydrolase-like protein with peptidoglycan-binding domain